MEILLVWGHVQIMLCQNPVPNYMTELKNMLTFNLTKFHSEEFHYRSNNMIPQPLLCVGYVFNVKVASLNSFL